MLSFFCVLGIESTHQLDYTNCTVAFATVFKHFYACADHLVEERQAMRLVGLLSPACALGLMSTALLIAATTAEYATQYFLASSPLCLGSRRQTPTERPDSCSHAGLRSSAFGEAVNADIADEGGSCRFSLVRSNRPIKLRRPRCAGAKERRVGHE